MTKHSHFPYTSTCSSTPHNTNKKHIAYFQTQRLKKLFNNGRYTTNIPTDPHTVTTTDIKTNMRHIHTSIVSRHLSTRGNSKILRTPPPHISSSEERLPRLTRRTLTQLRTNKSPFLKSYLHKFDAKSYPSPLCPPLQHPHTQHTITSTSPTYAPHCHPWICGQTPLECWSCWPDGEICWLVDQNRDDRTPITNKGQGSG